jgi:hypothetical protein
VTSQLGGDFLPLLKRFGSLPFSLFSILFYSWRPFQAAIMPATTTIAAVLERFIRWSSSWITPDMG